MPAAHWQHWTEAEISLIERNYWRLGAERLMALLPGRTLISVQIQASKLNLHTALRSDLPPDRPHEADALYDHRALTHALGMDRAPEHIEARYVSLGVPIGRQS